MYLLLIIFLIQYLRVACFPFWINIENTSGNIITVPVLLSEHIFHKNLNTTWKVRILCEKLLIFINLESETRGRMTLLAIGSSVQVNNA